GFASVLDALVRSWAVTKDIRQLQPATIPFAVLIGQDYLIFDGDGFRLFPYFGSECAAGVTITRLCAYRLLLGLLFARRYLLPDQPQRSFQLAWHKTASPCCCEPESTRLAPPDAQKYDAIR